MDTGVSPTRVLALPYMCVSEGTPSNISHLSDVHRPSYAAEEVRCDQHTRVATPERVERSLPPLLVVLAVQHLRVLGSEVLKVCLMMCTHIRECF